MNHYELLGVARDANATDLRIAWRAYAKLHHPDVSADPDAAERFAAGKQAFNVLADPKQRAAYDRALFVKDADLQAELSKVLDRDLTKNERRAVSILQFTARLWGLRR